MMEVDPFGKPDYAYVQAAGAIAVRSMAGELTCRLPAERVLAVGLGGFYQTLRHGMEVLRERGLIITRQGRAERAAGDLNLRLRQGCRNGGRVGTRLALPWFPLTTAAPAQNLQDLQRPVSPLLPGCCENCDQHDHDDHSY
jgi:hypothetical protein